MKKNAQSVEAWLEAMIAVARYYRLDFSQENVRATVNWERQQAGGVAHRHGAAVGNGVTVGGVLRRLA